MDMLYSVIIPVYNRPDHIEKLLECFVDQTYSHIEVIVVESGSTITSDHVVQKFKDKFSLQYVPFRNEGQGFSRNKGMEVARGDVFIIIDSDVLLDKDYIEQIHTYMIENKTDAFGGPDTLHPASTPFQKAVNFCMTSTLTTGGSRGKVKKVGEYHPRSFNMGFTREVYQKTGGFKMPFKGEDLELSHRIRALGFKVRLIHKAHVYHERKKDTIGFYKQIYFFGQTRIHLRSIIPSSFRIIHLLPITYTLYLFMTGLGVFTPFYFITSLASIPLMLYQVMVFISSALVNKSIRVSFLSLYLIQILMIAYSFGMISELLNPSPPSIRGK